MQSRIIRLAPYATFIPCFGHSLNLVGKEAASSGSEAVSFFDLIQALYVFFTASTSRHKKLFDVLQKKDVPVFMPKRLSDTRWSCRFDAVQAVKNGYEEIMNVLQDISEDTDEKAECRCTAKGLYDRMCKLETGIFTELWHVLLDRFNQSSKTLQSQTLNLNAACGILQSLTEFVIQQRDAFDEFEKRGIHLSGMEKYTAQLKRKSRRNTRLDPLDYGHCVESELSERESFRIKSFIPCMDSLIVCLQNRHSAYKDVAGRYGFLVDLPNMSQELLIKAATNLSRFYSNDLDDNFAHELVHFQIFLKGFLDQKENHVGLESFMYKLIMDKNVELIRNFDFELISLDKSLRSFCSGTPKTFFALGPISTKFGPGNGQTKNYEEKTRKRFPRDFRKAVDAGKRSGGGRVVFTFFNLCENLWGGSPAVTSISNNRHIY